MKNNDQKLGPAILLIRSDEKHWSRIASSYFVGLQHCIVGEGEF